MSLKIYKLSADAPRSASCDFYTEAVVVAASPQAARKIHPDGKSVHTDKGWSNGDTVVWPASLNAIGVEYIGVASPSFDAPSVISANFYGV